MAAVGSTSASADIAGSLTMEEIPIKLRCAACNKLAVNAFRLPCCEQSICENCQASLPEACPVCAHEPVKAELCKPNKALRTTIKVFLRTEEKKRETQKAKDLPELPPPTLDTPVAVETPGVDGAHIVQVDTSGAAKDVSQDEPMNVGHADLEPSQNIGGPASVEVQMDIPRPSVEVTSLDQQFDQSKEPTAELAIETGMIETDRSHVNAESKHTGGDEQGLSVPGRQGHSGQWGPGQGPVQGQLFAGSFGFDGTGNGFPSMSGYSQGDFNQMMHFMPNGMANTGMGGFPNMMGMSGMGMDPMGMSQGMYGGLGGQGMGMNGMNGMNMGMGFGAGQSAYGGFSGQAATWNGGQDKFNPNAFGGHASGMGGDFGANAGYGGYNMPPHQGNYGQMHQPQYSNNNYQNGYNGQGYSQSGRGRGRGYSHTGRGRGGYGPAMQGNQGKQEKSYEPFHHQLPSQLLSQNPSDQQQPTSANESGGKPDETGTKAAESALINHELNPGDEDDNADAPTKNAAEAVTLPKGDVILQPTEDSITAEIPVVVSTSEGTQQAENFRPAPIETMVIEDRAESDATPMQPIEEVAISPMTLMPPPTGPAAPLGPAALYKGDTSQDFAGRGRVGGRGYFRGGPDFRGGFRGRGSGFMANGIGAPSAPNGVSNPTSDFPVVVPVEPKGLGVEGAPKAPKALREGLVNTGIRGGRGFSIVGRASVAAQGRSNGSRRSRSSATPSRRRSESRSRSPSRHHSRHHRRHRHRSPSTSSYDSERERRRERRHRRSRRHEEDDDPIACEGKEERSRDPSVDSSSKRSSHRSHRDKDRDRRSSHKHRSSHRSHRDRSRTRSRDHRHRRKRSRSPSHAIDENTQDEPPKDPTQPVSPSSSRRKNDKDKDDSSSKHRDRDNHHRERKRSRRDRSVSPNDEDSEHSHRHRSSRRSKRDRDDRDKDVSSRSNRDRDNITNPNNNDPRSSKDKLSSKPAPPAPPPTAPKHSQPHAQSEKDPHTLEREARNRERLLKEQQRRDAVLLERNGKRRENATTKSLGGSGNAGVGRRVSYKYEYEDEESGEARARRVEEERESVRWE